MIISVNDHPDMRASKELRHEAADHAFAAQFQKLHAVLQKSCGMKPQITSHFGSVPAMSCRRFKRAAA